MVIRSARKKKKSSSSGGELLVMLVMLAGGSYTDWFSRVAVKTRPAIDTNASVCNNNNRRRSFVKQ